MQRHFHTSTGQVYKWQKMRHPVYISVRNIQDTQKIQYKHYQGNPLKHYKGNSPLQ